MPAKSEAQRRFMAIAEHNPSKLRGKRPKMTKSQLHDFTSTPEKGLPYHKRGNKTLNRFGK